MTPEEKELWYRISSFSLDDESSSFKFSQRLARENGWTGKYAVRVIEEYKKFIFLCCITESGITPSDQVDQAWHLHLTYTKLYWVDFCKNTLTREIHHNPTKGGEAEANKFDSYYTGTLKLYKEKFGTDAPKDIWPENDARFSDIDFQRVNLRNYWLLRRPGLTRKKAGLLGILLALILIVQACNGKEDYIEMQIVLAIFFAAVIFSLVYKSKGGGPSGCRGKSGGGCAGGCSGCSGCGSGCGGGGCGGGD